MRYRNGFLYEMIFLMFVMIGVMGCEQEHDTALTAPVDVLNFQQAGDPSDVDDNECQHEYGIHLIHGDAETGQPGQITLRLPVGNYTILYDTEGLAGNSKEVVVTSKKDWRVFIGTLAEHGRILIVMILNNDTGAMITAVLNGEIQEDAVCALDDEFGKLPQPESESEPEPGEAGGRLVIGDFETGDFTGWTIFTTPKGTLGTPRVVNFDTNNDTTATNSARFQVGQTDWRAGYQGGGIFQSVNIDAGQLRIQADIACHQPNDVGNNSGGLFELLFDGTVVDSHDFGNIDGRATEYATLKASTTVTAGVHENRIRMSRPFGRHSGTPFQYLDNITLSGMAIAP